MHDKNWINSLCIEMKIGKIIEDQARTGWLFNKGLCTGYVTDLSSRMATIDKELRPSLPIKVKMFGVIVTEPFMMSGKHKKMVTDWMEEDTHDVKGQFSRIYYEEMNLGSDKQVKEFLLGLGWKPTLWNIRKKDSKNGKRGERTGPKLHEYGVLCPNLDKLNNSLGTLLVEYVKVSHRRGLLAGLLKLVRADGRIPAEANTIGAATHRMTHKKIVNIPGCESFFGTEIRSLFIAKQGYSIVGVDSKSCQARMLCHYMSDDDYTQKVLKDDIHNVNKELVGLESRSMAKTIYYAFLFGAGDSKLGSSLGGGAKEGRKAKLKFLKAIPKIGKLIDNVKAAAEKRGYIYGLDGRKIYVSSGYKALNYLLQSAEAIYMKYAQAFLLKAITKEKLDCKFIATIHDEFQMEVLDAHVERVSELCLSAMLLAGKYLKINLPMEGDVSIGKDWSQTH